MMNIFCHLHLFQITFFNGYEKPWHGYDNEKVTYEDIFSVLVIQKAYKSFRMSLFLLKI